MTSRNQKRYLSYIRNNPGCSIADINRNCKINHLAGHRWIYDSVNRLIKRKLVNKTWVGGKTSLTIKELQ